MSELYRDFIDSKADEIITDLSGTITPAPSNAELYRDFLGRKFDDVITALNGSITPAPAGDELYRDFIERKFDDVIAGIGGYVRPVSFPTLTGSIVTFNAQYAGLPLKSCVVDFQDGTGIDSLDFTTTGKNLFDKDAVTLGKWITNTGTKLNTPKGAYSSYIPIITNIPYYFSHITGIGAFYSIAVYNENKIFIETVSIQGGGDSSGTITFTQGSYIRVNVYKEYLDIVQVELGDTATAYESFGDNKLFSFGKTIQSGSLNVLTGELTNNDTTPPEVINLGGMEIDTLQGENNIFADTGNTTLQYIKIGGNT